MLRDSFTIELILRHPSRSGLSIAKALSVEPRIACSQLRARGTYFQTILQSGDSPAKFRLALPRIVRFLRKNKKFWRDFIAEKGRGEIVFNCAIFPHTEGGDKCFELFLASAFCEHLSANGMGLKIQGWVKKSS